MRAPDRQQAVIAIDAGGSYFKTALVQGFQVITPSFYQASVHSQGTREEILAVYANLLRKNLSLAEELGIAVSGIGISTPGPFDYATGRSLMKHKFASIRGIPLAEEIGRLMRIPSTMPIAFCYDGHAFLLGEHVAGAARGFRNVAAVTIGTGLGMSALVNGEILHNGAYGPHPSCIIYNRTYRGGILEDRISSRGILERYNALSPLSASDLGVKELADLADKGDPLCRQIFEETAVILCDAVAPILQQLNAQCLILGGQISKSFQLFHPVMRQRLNISPLDTVAIKPAGNVDCASLIGVAQHLMRLESSRPDTR